MAVSDRCTVVKKCIVLKKNVNKSVKFHQKFVKNSSKNQFFVKTTYLEWPRNHSEHPIWSGIKFPVYREPQTAIWGKIGGFRFKSPHREQILLLLLKYFLGHRNESGPKWVRVQMCQSLNKLSFNWLTRYRGLTANNPKKSHYTLGCPRMFKLVN